MDSIQTLFEFIKAAEKNRKYLTKTASNRRTPLRLIETALTDEEKKSMSTLRENIDSIFEALYAKNQSKMSASSVNIYKSLLRRLIDDYENYGKDSNKMASWQPTLRPRKGKQYQEKTVSENTPNSLLSHEGENDKSNLIRSEIPLGSDRKVIILSPDPHTLTKSEVKIVQDFITLITGNSE